MSAMRIAFTQINTFLPVPGTLCAVRKVRPIPFVTLVNIGVTVSHQAPPAVLGCLQIILPASLFLHLQNQNKDTGGQKGPSWPPDHPHHGPGISLVLWPCTRWHRGESVRQGAGRGRAGAKPGIPCPPGSAEEPAS